MSTSVIIVLTDDAPFSDYNTAALVQIGHKDTKDLHLAADTEEEMWNWINSLTQAAAVPPPQRYLHLCPSSIVNKNL